MGTTCEWNRTTCDFCPVLLNQYNVFKVHHIVTCVNISFLFITENTYLSDFNKLLPNGSDREAYERRVEQIISALKGAPNRRYFVSSFPVFNTCNALVYDLVHCTSNIAGFRLYKRTAWKTFGDKSSTKNTHGNENLLFWDLEGNGEVKTKAIPHKCHNPHYTTGAK